MPIFFQQDIDNNTKLGVWKIEEGEEFFLRSVVPQRNVSHPHKKLQHLAGRYLLKYLFPDFPVELIQIADTRKPFLEDEAFHFSISHCSDYAAAIVSKDKRVGVDIEVVTTKVSKVQHKFVGVEEFAVNQEWAQPNLQSPIANRQLTLLWSCKEAAFKWYGLGEVDFKKHMVAQKQKQITASHFETTICFCKEDAADIILNSHFLFPEVSNPEGQEALVLSYVVT